MLKFIYYSILSGLLFVALKEVYNVIKAYLNYRLKQETKRFEIKRKQDEIKHQKMLEEIGKANREIFRNPRRFKK